jgi:hypothetical protein
MKKWVLAVAVLLLVVGGALAIIRLVPASVLASASPSAPGSASPSPVTLPSGGLSQDAAEAMVRAAGTADRLGKLRWAEAGPALHVMTAQAVGAAGIQPTRWIWSLEFDAMSGPICPPDGSSCFPSRPGSLHVYVDYFTGETISSGFSSSGG